MDVPFNPLLDEAASSSVNLLMRSNDDFIVCLKVLCNIFCFTLEFLKPCVVYMGCHQMNRENSFYLLLMLLRAVKGLGFFCI